jgi:hypothetical protein
MVRAAFLEPTTTAPEATGRPVGGLDEAYLRVAAQRTRTLKGRCKTKKKATPKALFRELKRGLDALVHRLQSNFGAEHVLAVAAAAMTVDCNDNTDLLGWSNDGCLHKPLVDLGVERYEATVRRPFEARKLGVATQAHLYVQLMRDELGIPGVGALDLALPLDELVAPERLRAPLLEWVGVKSGPGNNQNAHRKLIRTCLAFLADRDGHLDFDSEDDLKAFHARVQWDTAQWGWAQGGGACYTLARKQRGDGTYYLVDVLLPQVCAKAAEVAAARHAATQRELAAMPPEGSMERQRLEQHSVECLQRKLDAAQAALEAAESELRRLRATGGADVRATGGADVRATGGADVRATGGADVRTTDDAGVRTTDGADVRTTDGAAWHAATQRLYVGELGEALCRAAQAHPPLLDVDPRMAEQTYGLVRNPFTDDELPGELDGTRISLVQKALANSKPASYLAICQQLATAGHMDAGRVALLEAWWDREHSVDAALLGRTRATGEAIYAALEKKFKLRKNRQTRRRQVSQPSTRRRRPRLHTR